MRAGYLLYRAVASADLEEVSRILATTPEAARYENDNGENCLHAACEYGVENYTEHAQTIAQLVAAGCDLNKCSNDRGLTPLMTACYYGHATCVEALLRLGADATLKVHSAERGPHAPASRARLPCCRRAGRQRRDCPRLLHPEDGRHDRAHKMPHIGSACVRCAPESWPRHARCAPETKLPAPRDGRAALTEPPP